MNPYSLLIQWSDADEVFVVSLPEFGCKTHGSTYEQAAKSGRKVLELLVETYESDGKPLPKPATLQTAPQLSGSARRRRGRPSRRQIGSRA